MPLTDTNIRNAKPTGKVQKLSDGEGLYLHISTTGAKLWRMAYRFGGKQKTLSFGKYPTVTLQEARRRRAEAKEQLAAGLDPGEREEGSQGRGQGRGAGSAKHLRGHCSGMVWLVFSVPY